MTARAIPVLFVVPSLVRAGAESQVVELVNGLDPERFVAHLVVFGEPLDLLARVDRQRVAFHRLARRGRFDLSLPRRLAHLVDAHAIEVVHCTLQISLFYAWLARWFARRRPALVLAVHSVRLSSRDEFFDRWVYRELVARCRRVAYVCRAQADYWISRDRRLSATAIVVYNGVAVDRFDPAAWTGAANRLREHLGIGADQTLVACVARFRPEKAHDVLLHALARLGRPDVHLILAGDGELRPAIEEAVSALGLRERVHLLGDIDDVRAVYRAADLTVLASTSETFSMAMLESMAMATPVLATDVGGAAEAIVPGETGALVPAGDVEALARRLGELVADRAAAGRLGERARARVREHFSARRMVEKTQDMLAHAARPSSTGC